MNKPQVQAAGAIATPFRAGLHAWEPLAFDDRLPGIDPALAPVVDKVNLGQRLTLADGRLLFHTRDVWTVLQLAASVRRRLHGSQAFYNINRHLNYSNVCALSCKFCEFYRKKDEDGAYTRDMEYVREEVKKAVEGGATEMHSVGGLHPYLPFSYYTDLVSTIRDTARSMGSQLHVKAFTAVEVVHLARVAKVYKGASAPGEEGRQSRVEGIRYVLEQLANAGLSSLPGGGAEVFDDRVHDEAYKGKIRSDVWLDVHREAHALGLNTNATMLYGHIETIDDRLVHFDMLRSAQDEALAAMGYRGVEPGDASQPGLGAEAANHLGYSEHRAHASEQTPQITLHRDGVPLPEHVSVGRGEKVRGKGYYQTIIPLPFFPDGCDLEHLPGPSGLENYRTLAVSRLMLDNFPHVKAFWIMQTLPMAQIMLESGADDLDGTVVWYDITKVGGAGTHQEVTVWSLQKAIREAGFEPVERDTLYRRVERTGNSWRSLGTNGLPIVESASPNPSSVILST